jgi:hypothetical protein
VLHRKRSALTFLGAFAQMQCRAALNSDRVVAHRLLSAVVVRQRTTSGVPTAGRPINGAVNSSLKYQWNAVPGICVRAAANERSDRTRGHSVAVQGSTAA